MVDERLRVARELLASDGVVACSIDENEVQTLVSLMRNRYPKFIGTVVVQTNPKGRGMDESLATSNDFLLFAAEMPETVLRGTPKTEEQRGIRARVSR